MSKYKHIFHELKAHIPFTIFGAFIGIFIIIVLCAVNISQGVLENGFHILHPAHILLSAIVTAAVFSKHSKNMVATLIVGFVGSVGICSISDILLPHVGGSLLGAEMHLHMCLIEHPSLIIVVAFMGTILGAKIIHQTRCPHATHVMVSTMATLFYLVSFGVLNWVPVFPLVFILLFVSVWLPCCVSDILFPHLLTRT